MAKRFTPKRKLNKTNIQKVPDNKPVVYKNMDAKGKTTYVGIAQRGRVQERLQEHMRGGSDPIPGANSFTIKQMPSIEKARTEEKQIIKQEQPKHNEQGK